MDQVKRMKLGERTPREKRLERSVRMKEQNRCIRALRRELDRLGVDKGKILSVVAAVLRNTD